MLESFDHWMILAMGCVSFLYAFVGHGGASGYIAVMALWNIPVENIRSLALMLNVVVASLSFSHYYARNFFRWNIFFPAALASVPAAFAGSMITLNPILLKRLLGVILIIPIIRLLGINLPIKVPNIPFNRTNAFISGGIIGLLSGLLGIGGGILLSPILLMLEWALMKETAAVTALFTLVNSLAALSGSTHQTSIHSFFSIQLMAVVIVVVLGGWIGSWWGSGPANDLWIKRALTFVLGIASWKLLIT